MWVEITETTKPEPGTFMMAICHPMAHDFDKEFLYFHATLGWLKPGTYNKVRFDPTHFWVTDTSL